MPTSVQYKDKEWSASGGDGGGGGGVQATGSTTQPLVAKDGSGCRFGKGGRGGIGASKPPSGRLAYGGGSGGKGFPGETLVIEINSVAVGDPFDVTIGAGGRGGNGGDGLDPGSNGDDGGDGYVLFIPLFEPTNERGLHC